MVLLFVVRKNSWRCQSMVECGHYSKKINYFAFHQRCAGSICHLSPAVQNRKKSLQDLQELLYSWAKFSCY